MGSALLAIDTGLMGPTYSVSTACATANYCLYAVANHIRGGEADIEETEYIDMVTNKIHDLEPHLYKLFGTHPSLYSLRSSLTGLCCY